MLYFVVKVLSKRDRGYVNMKVDTEIKNDRGQSGRNIYPTFVACWLLIVYNTHNE